MWFARVGALATCAALSSTAGAESPIPAASTTPVSEGEPAGGARGGPASIEPTILCDTDYRLFRSPAEGNDGFSIARLRPGMVLSGGHWFRGVATVEYAGETPLILDGFAKLRLGQVGDVIVGYAKPPLFASFVHEPVQTLPFPDRAPVVVAFRVRRDGGITLHLAPPTTPIEGWLRVGNGSGSPLGNDGASPAGYVAVDLVLGRARVDAAPGQHSLGLRAGTSALVETVRDRDGIAAQTPFGFVYYRPTVVSGLRVVGEGHIVGYAGPIRLTMEGALARESRSRDSDGNPATPRLGLPTTASYGATAEIVWVVNGANREVGRAPRPIGDVGLPGTGPWEIAARYDGLWLGRGAGDIRAGGSQGGAFALKWWATDFLAASAFAFAAHYETPPLEEPNTAWSWGMMTRLSVFGGLGG